MEEKPCGAKEEEYKQYKEKLINNLLFEYKKEDYDEYKKLKESERYTIDHMFNDEYFQKVIYDIPEKDLPLIVQLKIYEKLNRIYDKQESINKNIKFISVITFIGLIILIGSLGFFFLFSGFHTIP